MITKIYIEGQLIDLFQDETIELNSSIANTDDISKINSDYTKTFTVPASDRNNYIFKHYYNADIDNTFDARTKKNAFISLGGFDFKRGKIRLEKVSVKKGKPSSYTINFWGNTVNIKNLFKEDELSSLDFSAYTHEQNYDNVKDGLTVGLFGGDIIYNLISHKKQFLYNPTDNTNTTSLVNIAYNGEDRGVNFLELKPSIRLLPIIEAIETKYNLIFSRDFFGRSEFTELYMWLSKDKNKVQGGGTQRINWNGGDTNNVDFTTDIATFTATASTNYLVTLTVTPSSGYESVPYNILVYRDGVQTRNITATGNYSYVEIITSLSGTTEANFYYEIQTGESFVYTASLLQIERDKFTLVDLNRYTTTASTNTITSQIDVSLNIPKIKVIDFMTGLFRMFKLVVVPENENQFYINTTKDYYREGRILDITDYIDFESYDVERGTINNQIDFKYQEPTTILNKQFKANTGIAYGDELLSLSDYTGEPLDGEKIDITLPFEQVVFERLLNTNDNTQTNLHYALIVDENLEPAAPKPIIFYNNNIQLSGTNLSLINETGNTTSITTTINTPSHTLGLDTHTFSTLWGVEFSTWNYEAIEETLFLNYWRDYIASIFNIKRRKFKFNAFLPLHLLTDIKLNDVLFIKDRYYRINDFTVNLITGKATLNLLNTFETNFGVFEPSNEAVYLNYVAQTYSVYVSNAPVSMGISLQDLGYGTAWATATQNGSFIDITVTENTLTVNRDLFINVNNGSGKSFQIYLNQDNKVVTFDTTVIKFDSTLITFDAQ